MVSIVERQILLNSFIIGMSSGCYLHGKLKKDYYILEMKVFVKLWNVLVVH